jgi:DNA primase
MKYPKEYLDEIKLRLKVSQVVGKQVQLKKRGKEFVGLSPFKNEKTPSFTVSDEKGFYHCFSTSEHGNIFDFVMKTKSLGFGEAVKTLAAEAGMQVYRFSNFDEKKEKRFQKYKNIYKDYLNFFHTDLYDTKNYEALKYLQKRNLSDDIIKEFRLGYVPWKNNFYEKLLKNYTEEEINLTGLYYKNDKTGKFIDRFNSRIIFPINNLSGDTVAFGGRIIKDSKLAKYINSPETDFYKKRNVVFNLDKAKSCRSETEEVIIVEGYMDVVSLYAAGFRNVISNSGTALTENQIELIWKFFLSPIICLDGDQSGQNAAVRIAEKLIALINDNNKIYFSIMPEGKDPDDFIKEHGKEKFVDFLKSKKIIQSFIWDKYVSEVETRNPFAISKFEKKIKGLCYSIKDETLKKYILEEFLTKIANLTPIQNKKNKFTPYFKKDLRILQETKALFKQRDHYTKEQIKEYSILNVMLNFPKAANVRLEELSELKLSTKNCEEFKNLLLKKLSKNEVEFKKEFELMEIFKELINEIEKNSNLLNMIKKNDLEKVEILDELILDLKEINQLKKIDSLESKFAQNMDESSYSELIKLKSQLNRD